jgi:tyrosyl-tRNA synthetase
MMPIIEGTDGVQKMSKSLGNYIGIDESPGEMYGKTMSIPDDLMLRYFELLTAVPLDEIKEIAEGLQSDTLHPRDVKMRLAREIVTIYHGKDAALQAEEEFKRVFQQHDLPEDIPTFEVPEDFWEDGLVWLPRILQQSGMCASTSEARRLIQQGAVRVDGERVNDPNLKIKPAPGMVIKAGKRKFIRIG